LCFFLGKNSIMTASRFASTTFAFPATQGARFVLLVVLMVSIAVLSGCATQSRSASVYRAGESSVEQTVRFGTIESIRQVTIQRDSKGVGVVAGGAVGGIAGSSVGDGRSGQVGAVLGAVLGGIAGQAIEERANQVPGVEITVRLESGRLVAIVQEDDQSLRAGDKVRLVGTGGAVKLSRQ
jgi:outer membrane lipoprotein SlyB